MFALLLSSLTASAQSLTGRRFANDPYFPSAGKFTAGVITTYSNVSPPPALIADVTYGVSQKTAIGLMGGTTGSLALVGLKVNTIIAQAGEHFRTNFRFATIYYPGRDGKFLFDRTNRSVMPWMLSMAMIDAEWRTNKGIRWNLGIGGMETHCVDGMMHLLTGKRTSEEDEEKELPLDLFNTVQGSFSVPVSKRLTFRLEVICAMKGSRLIESREYKVSSPINPYIQFVYAF